MAAVADGRNLFTIVRNNFVNLDDVNYNSGGETAVGTATTGGGPRTAVFTTSPGVRVRVEAGSQSGVPEQGYFEAFVYHIGGSGDSTPSGKREFWYLADEANGIYSLPVF